MNLVVYSGKSAHCNDTDYLSHEHRLSFHVFVDFFLLNVFSVFYSFAIVNDTVFQMTVGLLLCKDIFWFCVLMLFCNLSEYFLA